MAERAASHRPRLDAALVFDLVVMAAGAASLVQAALRWFDAGGRFNPWLLLAAPAVMVMSRYPIVLRRESSGIEIGLDSAVLVFLALVAPLGEATLVWAGSTVVTQLATPKGLRTRLFNTGLCTFAGWLALQVMALGHLGDTRPVELLAVAAGCLVYFVVDYLLTALTVALLSNEELGTVLWDSNAPLSLLCFVGIDCLGYLAGAVTRYAGWLLPLIAAPLVTLLVATRAFDRAHTDRVRMGSLFDLAVSAQQRHSAREITDTLVAQARLVVRCPEVRLRAAPPGENELGVRLPDTAAGDANWLVASPRITGLRFDDADQKALEAVAAVAVESLARARLVEEMGHLARHDPLTGLANRALFRERVEQAIKARQRAPRPLAVLFADLDSFKAINDSLGHEAGDELLVLVAERLRTCVRPADTVARLGGDEFAVLLEDLPDPGEVHDIATRLVAELAAPFQVRDTTLHISVSVGIATGNGGEDATVLLRNSDRAMYEAKARGKNQYATYTSATLQPVDRLRRGLHEDQLVLHYQPVVHLESGIVDGVEALLRWRQPDGTLLSPAEFIPLAEESGLIKEIGAWVLDRAHADARAFAAHAGRGLSLGVNVSGRQLDDDRLVEVVRALPPTPDVQLLIEVTESVVVRSPTSTRVLEALRGHGALIALDDFGTGYSSLSALRRLPAHVLKLDMSFVRDLCRDAKAAAMIEAIMAMTRSLGLVVVAEGIEEPEQADRLQQLGCRLGQGYLYARPLPAEDVLALLGTPALTAPVTGGATAARDGRGVWPTSSGG